MKLSRLYAAGILCLTSLSSGSCGSGGGSAATPRPVITPAPGEPRAAVPALDPNACCKQGGCDRDAFRRAGGVCAGDSADRDIPAAAYGGVLDQPSFPSHRTGGPSNATR